MKADEVARWLPALPDGWAFVRGKFLLREIDERSETGDDLLLSLTRDRGVVPRSAIAEGEHRADTLVGYKRVRAGQIVMNKMQAWNSMFGLSTLDGVISPDYAVFEGLPNSDPRFLTYQLQSRFYAGQFLWRSRGMGTAFLRLHPENLLDTPLVYPPRPVQANIAEFLEAETVRIDALVEKKRRLIEQLEQRFRAEIDRVLDFDSAEHVRLGRATKAITQGVSPQAENREADDAEWAVLKLSAVRFGKYRPHENKAFPSGADMGSGLVPKVGDLLVTRSNTPNLVGDACAVREEAPRRVLCDLIYRVTLDTRVLLPAYAAYCLISSSGRGQLEPLARGSSQSMVKLRGEDVKMVTVPLAPTERQAWLVSELDGKRATSDKCIEAIERQIGLLHEHRQSLITAAVTGEPGLGKAA